MNSPRHRRQKRRYVNRNRQWGARQNTFSISMKGAVPIVLGLVVLVGHLVFVHMRDAVQDEIMKEESRSFALQEELQRENAAWARMRTPRSLAVSLAANGVSMSLPRSSQRIAMSGRQAFPGASSGGVYAANR